MWDKPQIRNREKANVKGDTSHDKFITVWVYTENQLVWRGRGFKRASAWKPVVGRAGVGQCASGPVGVGHWASGRGPRGVGLRMEFIRAKGFRKAQNAGHPIPAMPCRHYALD